ncbi:GNAT family N-acetyltransferase [Syntrophomonas palmitatica]|uniref:GNAT family N-acetyltransferase n=1 Tax=Syntrophomonas palmitatica TaxID=402877 RepID=UPI0006D20FAC|nr:GNAT family protein [Syntrophomonas palmitatica]
MVGDRIYLRRIEKDDLEGNYFQWLNDQEVTRWMLNGIFPNSVESMLEYYQKTVTSSTAMNLAIIIKENDRHIGNIGLHNIHPVVHAAEIGILIGEKDVWGQGYATEAIKLLSAHAFYRMNLNRISSGAVVHNIGSIRAFEKAGFKQEGISRQAYYCEGEYVDCVRLGLLRYEWEMLKS